MSPVRRLHPLADDFIRRLESEGHRVTSPRRAVVDAVSHREAPFTAAELCDSVPGIGRATVYRNLRLLQELGFLCRVLMEDGSPRYQPSHSRHHHHLVCVECGLVREFDCDIIDRLAPHVSRQGLEMVGHRLEIYGRCTGGCGRKAAN